MSYLSLKADVVPVSGLSEDTLAACRRVTISLWFRVPKTTTDKVAKEYNEWQDGPDWNVAPHRFMGVVPLMTWGKTNLRSRPFYYPLMATGVWPGVFDKSWSDGSGFPSCLNARWTTTPHGGLPAGAAYMENQYSYNKGSTGTFIAGGNEILDGSFIGVDCTGEDPALSVNIVMPVENKAKFSGGSWSPITSRTWSGPIYFYSGSGNCPGGPGGMYFMGPGDISPGRLCYLEPIDSRTDVTTHGDIPGAGPDCILGCFPETFRTMPARFTRQGLDLNTPPFEGAKITPDKWHHLLMSFDLSNKVNTTGQKITYTETNGSGSSTEVERDDEGSRTTSTCRMWIALDDVNLLEKKLSAYWPRGSSDPHAVLTVNGFYTADDVVRDIFTTGNPIAACDGTDLTTRETYDTASYEFTPAKLDMTRLGIPAVDAYVDHVRNVEMAELQLFTGLALDTGMESNRRAFVSPAEDGNGDPIMGEDGLQVMKPVFADKKGTEENHYSSGSIEYLGREPDILLHGSGKWKKGDNTGRLGVDGTGKPIPGGKFKPTGRIITYRPDPTLHGPQTPEELAEQQAKEKATT